MMLSVQNFDIQYETVLDDDTSIDEHLGEAISNLPKISVLNKIVLTVYGVFEEFNRFGDQN